MAHTPNETKQGQRMTAKAVFREEIYDFSLVLGDPLFQFFRKARLSGDHLELLYRRLIAITSIAWVPLLLLDSLGSQASSIGRLSFLHDVEVQVRFLVALPVLIGVELIVHSRIRPVVRRFVERGLVREQDLPRFQAAIEAAARLRNSIPVVVALLISIYTLGLWLWSSRFGIDSPTWYAMPGGRWNLTPAGYWYVLVSIPILQFLLLRWYVRLFIWYRFLWHVSRLNLHLVPIHPDHCAGLAFLGKSAYAFGPILFAQGAMLAGLVASRVLYRGESLLSFKLEMGGFVVFFVLAILGPLLMFTPKMAAAKRKGLARHAHDLPGQRSLDRLLPRRRARPLRVHRARLDRCVPHLAARSQEAPGGGTGFVHGFFDRRRALVQSSAERRRAPGSRALPHGAEPQAAAAR